MFFIFIFSFISSSTYLTFEILRIITVTKYFPLEFKKKKTKKKKKLQQEG